MAIKYQCCYCRRIFPAGQEIDAYAQGYKVGFLCPHCGCNIKAGLMARQKIRKGDYPWLAVAVVLMILMYSARFSERTIVFAGVEVTLYSISFSVFLVYALVAILFKRELFSGTTFLTEPVEPPN